MRLVPVKTPKAVKKIFPNYVWDIPNAKKSIYLTFDDGPTPEITNWTLNTLEIYKAKATFFCLGKNIEAHPHIFKKIIAQGHRIGNHTQNHKKGWKTKTKKYIEDTKQAQRIIDAELQKSTTVNQKSLIKNLFRPPYGQITPKQGKTLMALHYKIIMWDVIAFDWDKNITPEHCLKNVISKVKNGSIVVFHDSVKASKNLQYALPKTLNYLSSKGYTFKALPA